MVLEMAVRAGAGHIAPSFSCADILVALYCGGTMRFDPRRPHWPARDRFILSKGQAAVALYAVLAGLGFFPEKELLTFTREGSRLGGHTENTVPGVEAFTGSLGMGLSIAAGMALAAGRDRRGHRCFVLLGDGECHEGSVWEAAMFCGHHRLNNLIAVVDHNGLSATDRLGEYLDPDPLDRKWESFGWEVNSVDGHDMEQLCRLFSRLSAGRRQRPQMVIAHTVKGKGVGFMENRPIWHYRIPAGKELVEARRQLARAGRQACR